jgi:hypothetical protein
MKTYRIGVIGLGQRIAHVLAAMQEVGWRLDVAGHVDPDPVGAPILAAAGIAPGPGLRDAGELIAAGPYDLLMVGTPNHLHFEHINLRARRGFPVLRREADRADRGPRPWRSPNRLAEGQGPPLFIGLVCAPCPSCGGASRG